MKKSLCRRLNDLLVETEVEHNKKSWTGTTTFVTFYGTRIEFFHKTPSIRDKFETFLKRCQVSIFV